jgi:hypothetical protein
MVAQDDFTVNIHLGTAELDGIDPQYPGLMRVRVPLEPRPPAPWLEIFESGPPDVPFSVSMHPPHIASGDALLRAPDDEIERYMQALHARVAGTTAYYNRQIAPKVKAQHEARQREDDERQRRIDEARKRLEDL